MLRFLFPASLFLLIAGGPGCGAARIRDLPESALEVRLDSNVKTCGPGLPVRLKFFVDMTNRSGGPVSLEGLKVELEARRGGSPDVMLRQGWTYRHNEKVFLASGRKLSIPVVPEKGEPGGASPEFPLEMLAPGTYDIVAVVNGKHSSLPYSMKVIRPEIGSGRARGPSPRPSGGSHAPR